MNQIICANTPSDSPTDFWATFGCSCGGVMQFDVREGIPNTFNCPLCGQSYDQRAYQWLGGGRKGIIIMNGGFRWVDENEKTSPTSTN